MRERTLRIYLDVGCVKNNNNEHSDAEGKKNTNEQRTTCLQISLSWERKEHRLSTTIATETSFLCRLLCLCS